jgi:Antitoxin VbhA
VEGSADDHESVDIAALLSDSDLSAEYRRYVHNALACSMLEGWRPTRESVALLIDAVAGTITAEEYRARVVASAATRGRQFGQLPTISVPDDFDDPLARRGNRCMGRQAARLALAICVRTCLRLSDRDSEDGHGASVTKPGGIGGSGDGSAGRPPPLPPLLPPPSPPLPAAPPGCGATAGGGGCWGGGGD